MHSNDGYQPNNGHKRQYVFTRMSEYPSLPDRYSTFWVERGTEVAVYTAAGSVNLDRTQLAHLLWEARNNPLMTVTGYYDHLFCECPKQVNTSKDPQYQERWYTKFGMTSAQRDALYNAKREKEEAHA